MDKNTETAIANPRHIHDGDIVRCGDVMRTNEDGSPSFRTCGGERCRLAERGEHCGEVLERNAQCERAVYEDGYPGPRWTDAVRIAREHGCSLSWTHDGANLFCTDDPGQRAPASRALAALEEAGIHLGRITVGCVAPADRRVAERLADLSDIEPPAGWEKRAVERAQREGVIGP